MKLRLVSAEDVSSFKSSLDPVNPSTLESAREILQDVQTRGLKGLQDQALRLGDIEKPDQQILLTREDLSNAFKSIPTEQQELLLRVAGRIRTFAQHQLDSLKTFRAPVPGGYASQRVDPVARAGCYAPGGRFPLPSSVLMTAITAVVAGVKEVLVASPRPAEITKAAAFVSGASGLIAVGGAQAVAAMAYGIPEIGISPVDVIVGPGNKWVTAAKQLVSGTVAIDMLAGPSELLVIADQSADPEIVAADLIAQAEHDVVALPVLVTTFPKLVKQVEEQLSIQLENLPTKETATKCIFFLYLYKFGM